MNSYLIKGYLFISAFTLVYASIKDCIDIAKKKRELLVIDLFNDGWLKIFISLIWPLFWIAELTDLGIISRLLNLKIWKAKLK